ncbi:MAG: hypothetical protein HLUCCA11_14720 [Phormidesmis priestleyi Ana]|uniref:Uncharacterized protein n=1 Tax=Phormidesmis priestleyi Ana TaxID=1666911 RepID=A0A0P8DE94_9CYAN|nr:MAG: hypothetical protein HLUCCA11_14720 [Phormidesmis priestleyi Ana]
MNTTKIAVLLHTAIYRKIFKKNRLIKQQLPRSLSAQGMPLQGMSVPEIYSLPT